MADCSYLACQLPTCMLEVCGDEGCMSYLHHACMVAYQEEEERHALIMGIYITMFKRCKQCLNNFIQEQTRRAQGGLDQGGPDQSGGGVDLEIKNALRPRHHKPKHHKQPSELNPRPNKLSSSQQKRSKCCRHPKCPKPKGPSHTKYVKYVK
eukprot:15333997-Ditylum_brightwellii.AAC.1